MSFDNIGRRVQGYLYWRQDCLRSFDEASRVIRGRVGCEAYVDDWIEIAPPNSLILVVGATKVDIPASFDGALIVATDTCVAIGCKAEDDGPSRFALKTIGFGHLDRNPAFVGWLKTPNGTVALETVFGERLAEHPAPSPSARITIWVNDDTEPDEILVGVE